MRKKKIFKSSIIRQNQKIKPTLYKRENMEFFLTNGNATIASIEKFADDQLDYFINNEDSLHINEYYLSKGVRKDVYYDWTKKSKYLKERHQLCLEILGLRREKLMAKHNPSTLKHTLHQYSEAWANANKYYTNLKKKDEKKSDSIFKVFMPRYESTSKVPKREGYSPKKFSLPEETIKLDGQIWERVS